MNYLIAGLGNPGKRYQNTRHNTGFVAIDHCANQWRGQFTASSNADTLVADVMISGRKSKLIKPQTFMNKSGLAVRKVADYFDVPPNNILIIHDDIALPLGELRISKGSSAGGHNGVQSVIDTFGTQKFTRLRIGIDDRGGESDTDTRSYVLGQFTGKQKAVLQNQFSAVREGIKKWVKTGPESAMNLING
jgi:PTH1 family peptidyl-tRNA hydrolase